MRADCGSRHLGVGGGWSPGGCLVWGGGGCLVWWGEGGCLVYSEADTLQEGAQEGDPPQEGAQEGNPLCEQTKTCENITFRYSVCGLYAVGNNRTRWQ